MKLPYYVAAGLVVAPTVVLGALFPKNSLVKVIDAKEFKQVLKPNMTSVVAFVAPWCGHCQKMAPEYSKAALGLYPLIPLYAVDCDAQANKRLCAEQGVKGFPTVKLFPRGKTMPPVDFDGPQRSASAFFYWASRAVPSKIKKIYQLDDVPKWAKDNLHKPRALLMNKSNKMPLLWSVLGNKYRDSIIFASHRDRRGKSSIKMGFPAGEDKVPKVLIYGSGATEPVQFQGILKFDPLSAFFDSVLDGTADLSVANQKAAQDSEQFVQDEREAEIERQQEAEMLKLAHGGYAEFIDFEQAVKDGHGKDYHAVHGYAGAMGGLPKKKGGAGVDADADTADGKPYEHKHAGGSEDPEDPADPAQGDVKMPATDAGGQVVLDLPTSTKGQPQTPKSEPEGTAKCASKGKEDGSCGWRDEL